MGQDACWRAAMSTMSSSMNSSATVFLKDIYIRFINKDVSDRKQLHILRYSTVAFGLIGITFGICMIGAKSLLDVWWKLSGIFAGGMLGIFLLGFLVKKATNMNAKIATVLGIVLIGWMSFRDYLPDFLQTPFEPKMTVVFGTLGIVGIGYLTHLFTKK